jgi:GNAT superfamily N-acetyltransferase
MSDDSSSFQIRAANPADATALARLATQLGYPSSQEQVQHRLVPLSGNPEHAVRVAVRDGQVVGWVHAFVCRLVESDPYAEIGGLVVNEPCRGEGAGRLLLRRVEQWAREKGCQAVSLRCNVLREKTHVFYEGLGYARIKTQHTFRKEL